MKITPLLGKLVEGYVETTFTGSHAIFNAQAWVERTEHEVLATAKNGRLVKKTEPIWFFVIWTHAKGCKSTMYKTEKGAMNALRRYLKTAPDRMQKV